MEELLRMIETFSKQETVETEEKIRDYDSTHEKGAKSKYYYELCGYAEGIKAMTEAIEEHCLMNGIEIPEEVTGWGS